MKKTNPKSGGMGLRNLSEEEQAEQPRE